jgi:hypothetical protein
LAADTITDELIESLYLKARESSPQEAYEAHGILNR